MHNYCIYAVIISVPSKDIWVVYIMIVLISRYDIPSALYTSYLNMDALLQSCGWSLPEYESAAQTLCTVIPFHKLERADQAVYLASIATCEVVAHLTFNKWSMMCTWTPLLGRCWPNQSVDSFFDMYDCDVCKHDHSRLYACKAVKIRESDFQQRIIIKTMVLFSSHSLSAWSDSKQLGHFTSLYVFWPYATPENPAVAVPALCPKWWIGKVQTGPDQAVSFASWIHIVSHTIPLPWWVWLS